MGKVPFHGFAATVLAVSLVASGSRATAEEFRNRAILLPQAAAAEKSICIQLDAAGQLSVAERGETALEWNGKGQTLFLWTEQGRDRWQMFPAAASTSHGNISQLTQLPIPSAHRMLHAIISPFPLTPVSRGETFLTPSNGGALLYPRMVLRRRARDNDPRFPRSAAVLIRGSQTILRIPFMEGQQRVALKEITGLAVDLKEGLRPGAYALRMEGETAETTFVVVDVARRAVVM
jgi:hypothetical protein